MNHIDPSISSASSSGAVLLQVHDLLAISTCGSRAKSLFRTATISFDPRTLLAGDPGVRVDQGAALQGRSNSRFDPIVVPIGYHFGCGNRVVPVESGKCPDPSQPWHGESAKSTPKTKISFDGWLRTQPKLPKPSGGSYPS